MRYLPLPADAGDQIIIAQCRTPSWTSRQTRWLAAAATYRQFDGSPWHVRPADFTAVEKEELFALYDKRARSRSIARIRRPEGGYNSCPMCGSPGGPSLDHALPRRRFPEFSILRENLVPACTMCNSEEKGDTYRGVRPERFIHPYYDRWASQPLWQVEFEHDLDALQFKPVALTSLSSRRQGIVNFHVTTLLGKSWRDSVRREWGSLPASLRRRVGAAPSSEAMLAELEIRLEDEMDSSGVNCWQAGFLRGVLANSAVIAKLIERVHALPPERR